MLHRNAAAPRSRGWHECRVSTYLQGTVQIFQINYYALMGVFSVNVMNKCVSEEHEKDNVF